MQTDHLKRREFITLFASAATWPFVARAQQSAMPVIGFLNASTRRSYERYIGAFYRGLEEAGYTEHVNVAIEYRWADGQYDRLRALAADLVGRGVSVIAATGGSPPALAAKAATSTIPIVFRTGFDPVEVGLVTNLARPGGNVTGITTLTGELGQKQFALLHELVPAARRVGVLVNPTRPKLAEVISQDVQGGADAVGVELLVLNASTDHELDEAFATLVDQRVGALVIGADAFFFSRSERLASLSLQHSIPSIYQYRDFPAAGGLMSYGGSFPDAYRLVGLYVGRILNGEKPGDLPVQRSTKLELILNLKTAKALGLPVPQTLLVSADEVIE